MNGRAGTAKAYPSAPKLWCRVARCIRVRGRAWNARAKTQPQAPRPSRRAGQQDTARAPRITRLPRLEAEARYAAIGSPSTAPRLRASRKSSVRQPESTTNQTATWPGPLRPVHRHDAGACELPIGWSLSTVAGAMRHREHSRAGRTDRRLQGASDSGASAATGAWRVSGEEHVVPHFPDWESTGA